MKTQNYDYHQTPSEMSRAYVFDHYRYGDCGNCGRCFTVEPLPFKMNSPFEPPAKYPEFPWTCNNCGKGYKAKP
jgi:hypothetical protein